MERAKLQAHVKGLKPHFPESEGDDGSLVSVVKSNMKPYDERLGNEPIPRMVEDGVSPEHYARWAFEPITFIMANNIPYAVGNVIKYVMRYDSKDGLKDLKKAQRYIDMLIEQEYGKENV